MLKLCENFEGPEEDLGTLNRPFIKRWRMFLKSRHNWYNPSMALYLSFKVEKVTILSLLITGELWQIGMPVQQHIYISPTICNLPTGEGRWLCDGLLRGNHTTGQRKLINCRHGNGRSASAMSPIHITTWGDGSTQLHLGKHSEVAYGFWCFCVPSSILAFVFWHMATATPKDS